MQTDTRWVARAVVLVAIGVALAPFTSFPVGIARINPAQHFVNVVGAILLGPWWAVGIAAIIGIIRNAMGVGTLLAFPGGMIGALLAGYVYRYSRNIYLGALGEIIGTGIIAAIVSALIVAPVFMGRTVAMGLLIASFLGSTVAGSIIGLLALWLLELAGYTELGGVSMRGMYLEVLKKYAVFSGRAQRKEYWMFFLCNLIIAFALGLIERIAGIATESNQSLLVILYGLAVLLPGLAVGVRRLHDTGRSGWWLLIALVPIIGTIVLLVFLVQDSQPGDNQYGPNSKRAADAGALSE